MANAGIELFEEPKIELEWEAQPADKTVLPGLTLDVDDPMKVYLREVGRVPRLTRESEIELAKQIERGGEQAEAAKTQLLESNLRLVVSIAERHTDRGVHILGLIQEGNTGLMEAVQHFDYRRGYRFSTYATWWVHRAIRRATPPRL